MCKNLPALVSPRRQQSSKARVGSISNTQAGMLIKISSHTVRESDGSAHPSKHRKAPQNYYIELEVMGIFFNLAQHAFPSGHTYPSVSDLDAIVKLKRAVAGDGKQQTNNWRAWVGSRVGGSKSICWPAGGTNPAQEPSHPYSQRRPIQSTNRS